MQKHAIVSHEGFSITWIGTAPPSGTQLNLIVVSSCDPKDNPAALLASPGSHYLSLEVVCGNQSVISRPRFLIQGSFDFEVTPASLLAAARSIELRVTEDCDIGAELFFLDEHTERFVIPYGANLFKSPAPVPSLRVSMRAWSAAGELALSGIELFPDVDLEFAPRLSAGVFLVGAELVRYADGKRLQTIALDPKSMVSAAEFNNDYRRLAPAVEFITLMAYLREVRININGPLLVINLVYQDGEHGNREQSFHFSFAGFGDPWDWFRNPILMCGASSVYQAHHIPALR